jgi:hypothetical protein
MVEIFACRCSNAFVIVLWTYFDRLLASFDGQSSFPLFASVNLFPFFLHQGNKDNEDKTHARASCDSLRSRDF